MRTAIAGLLLALPMMAACTPNQPKELVCYKPNPMRLTVHYKNADRILYNNTGQVWVITYYDTKDFAGGVVYYKQDLHESCAIRGDKTGEDDES